MLIRAFLAALICVAMAIPRHAAAQASAEAALSHALSSSAGNTLSKVMGRATGHVAGKLGEKTGNAVSPQKVKSITNPVPSRTAPATQSETTVPYTGSLIASIQGGEPACTETKVPDAQGKSPEGASKSEHKAPNCAPKHEPVSHPSVVNLGPAR